MAIQDEIILRWFEETAERHNNLVTSIGEWFTEAARRHDALVVSIDELGKQVDRILKEVSSKEPPEIASKGEKR